MMAMHSGSMKHESLFAEDDLMTPFGMSFASMAGMDISTTQSYEDSNAQVELSHSQCPAVVVLPQFQSTIPV
jgi:hypothetical protein